ncbi:MAG: flagellar protein export ATPase FliI [Bacillota bacterium]
MLNVARYRTILEDANAIRVSGKVVEVIGLIVEVSGLVASIGEVCKIFIAEDKTTDAEVVGFRQGKTLIMPLGSLDGVAPGAEVIATGNSHQIKVGPAILGKVLDGLGRPLKDPHRGWTGSWLPVNNTPPNPLKRKRIADILVTGVKTIDGLLTCGEGQRLGIFAGSGVGKSTLLGMVARHSNADVNVIALVGERGREVLEFLDQDLGEEGLAKSVVVAATSDQPALVRIKGAFVATAIAEYFRDQGLKVMLMMDSVTRFAMAQREVGLAIGEPPATKGYTPSVFALLPKLLERSGNDEVGSITGLYTVLVEADDMNEPVADAVRGILDGHIVLSRQLAARNHYPAIDVANSISRLMVDITTAEQQSLATDLRETMGAYQRVEDLINIGAYQKGSNQEVDRAITLYPAINRFLKQQQEEHFTFEETLLALSELFS